MHDKIIQKVSHALFLLIHTDTHQDDSKAPEVARLVISRVVKKFGRGVLQREARRLQRSAAGWKQACKPEIDHFQQWVLSLISKKYILGEEQRKRASRRKDRWGTTYLAYWELQLLESIKSFFVWFYFVRLGQAKFVRNLTYTYEVRHLLILHIHHRQIYLNSGGLFLFFYSSWPLILKNILCLRSVRMKGQNNNRKKDLFQVLFLSSHS